MRAAGWERLSGQDRTFLVFEEPSLPMHLGALTLFEGGALLGAGGADALARLRAHVRSRLHLAPRYRQRLAYVPVLRRPVWVDDERFDVRRHVRRISVSPVGDEARMRRVVARVFERPLDRTHPLWELWLLDGLGEGRIGVLVKTHHAVADGISAFDLFGALLSAEPTREIAAPKPWRPRRMPGALELLAGELRHETSVRGELTRKLARSLREPRALAEGFVPGLRAVAGLTGMALRPPAQTPHNRPVGPRRAFEWLSLDLGDVKAVKQRLGGTVNDVVLATVCGAVRSFLQGRQVDPHGLEYRVVVPVSLRADEEQGLTNNRVSAWLARLPLDEADPLPRYARLVDQTRRLKASQVALGPGLLAEAAELMPPGALELGVRLTALLHPYNLIVSNVAGPPGALWLLDSRLRAGHPQVPLFAHQGLGVALLSHEGSLGWGFTADPRLVPDLPDFVAGVRRSFRELSQAAALLPARAVSVRSSRASQRPTSVKSAT